MITCRPMIQLPDTIQKKMGLETIDHTRKTNETNIKPYWIYKTNHF